VTRSLQGGFVTNYTASEPLGFTNKPFGSEEKDHPSLEYSLWDFGNFFFL